MTDLSRHILIVEDDVATQELLRETLAVTRHALEVEGDGLAALARLRRERFDLVLLDIHLPGMDGLEILARLRELDSPPCVVVMTADSTPDKMLRAIRDQASRYVSKPISPHAVLELVA